MFVWRWNKALLSAADQFKLTELMSQLAGVILSDVKDLWQWQNVKDEFCGGVYKKVAVPQSYVTEEQLAALFTTCGQVVDCRVCGDPKSVLCEGIWSRCNYNNIFIINNRCNRCNYNSRFSGQQIP
ncbi:hypothetical protein M8C21_002338 [Ambrosia artemisiifolia]|uniref:RRM domain-containing protein n=1 Tax=Ambrosia artemisiifolia TaxID=4212 RepID=A0AAD5DAW3_AMBAR|nr:hypothetical protein M8C21_002338 [Ambrosia artemisiifolia]